MRFPQAPPPYLQLAASMIPEKLEVLSRASPVLPDGRYPHWDELRFREPPTGLSVGQWWATLKWARRQSQTSLAPMKSAYTVNFGFVPTALIQQTLHDLDRTNVARELLQALGNEDAIAEYRVRQLIEEAISSSVLEGARPTTRELARQLVRERRAPATRDERMIYNNWRAMKRIVQLRDEDRPLIVDDLLELHRILGEDALDVPEAAGALRGPEHNVLVEDIEGNVWHTPPPAAGLRSRLERLLQFAEGGHNVGDVTFIHPIIRAIIVHFWIGYEHPFRDGNGRIARAVYYWCMLRHGYEMAEFLSISGPIDRSPKAYYLAFAFTETDDGDLTYFVLHQLKVMREALAELSTHLNARAKRMAQLARSVAGFDALNHRQRAVLQHAIRHPTHSYTVEGHAESHRVHYQTARTDFIDLVKGGYFEARRIGKGKRYFPSETLPKRLTPIPPR
jgi:Fic family protein